MFNKISKSIILTLEVCCIAIMLLSCNNFLNPNKSTFIPETITTEKAYIEISTKFSRTVLPQSYDEFSRGLSWTLSVTKLGDTSAILTRTWNDDNATTAYQRMINTKDISLESGEYTFTLVTSFNGLKVLESTLQKNLISGINTLSFSMQEATGDDVENGQVNFTLNWTVDNIISKVVSTFQEYNGNEISTDTNDTISENSYNFTKDDVKPGSYILKIELQQMDPITKNDETINRFSCLVRVAPGLVSSGEATIQSLAPLYTINYILNEGALQSGITQVSYNSYTSFELPIPEKDGFDFVGWYTDANLTQKVEDSKFTLTSDITLYAKWEKQRFIDPDFKIGDQDENKYEVDSTKASFDTYNGYGILTVYNPSDSTSVWDYYIEHRDLFSIGKNYSVSVDLKTDDSDTVVGIAAANCDMFFTVGTEWQTYTFETGYLETATSNGITIGSALANKLYISDIVISEIADDGLPILSFNVTKTGIQNYLNQPNKPEQIIKVSKTDNNSGYEITINTPISSTDSSQNVTLQLRDYAYVGNMNKASFNLTSTDEDLKTSIKGFSVNQEEIDNNNNKIKSWNTPATFQQNNTVFFPAFANEENGGNLVPCIIEGILSSGTSDSTTISISNFNIVEATTDVIQRAGKTYAINIGNSWCKSYVLPFSDDSNATGDVDCQVLFINDFETSPAEVDWKECIRFLHNDTENFSIADNQKVTLNSDFTISVEDKTYVIGDSYPNNEYPIGVVFETGTNYVKILALEEASLNYGTDTCKNYISSLSPTFTNTQDGSINLSNWYNFVSNDSSLHHSDFPAFNYCYNFRESEGETGTWYLPSNSELSSIYGNINTINDKLNTISGATILDTTSTIYYWSSTYTTGGNAYCVLMNSNVQNALMIIAENKVRPCKKIILTNGSSYTDTTGVNFSGQTYTKTSLVTVISEEANIGYNYTANDSIFNFYEGGVKLSPFAMGQYEVTQELYEAVMEINPSGFTAETITVGENQDYRPVDSVNWYQAVAFCNELTKKTLDEANCVYYSDSLYTTVYTVANANSNNLPYFDQSKKGYRLPTEAEWEFAARGGVYSSDENSVWNYDYPGTMSDIDSVAWYVYNPEEKTHEVGLKDQNSLYLYDMAGNLMEWCWDYYDAYSAGELSNNPTGINEGDERVLRGGYYDDFDYCLSTSRYCDKPALTNISTLKAVGFRLCRSL